MPEDLDRFVAAQDAAGIYEQALAELADGAKRSHWMWFVFPQLAGLGRSPIARRFGVRGREEARAYLDHPVLAPRLHRAMRAAAEAPAPSASELLGPVDAIKLRSSATLFQRIDPDEPAFGLVLTRWYAGEEDPATLDLL